MIDLFDVSLQFPGHPPLFREVNLHLEKGGYTLVTGASGAGKTTLLMLLSGVTPPTSGQVALQGHILSTLPLARLSRLRRQVGFVFQDFRLLDHRTVYENVALVPEAMGVDGGTVERRTRYVLQRLGLEDVIKRYPEDLSGGEKQRVAIARAVVNEPLLVLADEPTGNLDDQATGYVLDLLGELHHKGASIILATHDQAVTSRLSHPVLSIENQHLLWRRKV